MKEERFPHTRKPLHWWGRGVGRGEALEPRRTAKQQGCGGQSGEIPTQRIGADQHSPAWEACLLTHQGGWGLGAEARASEVRPQGEDWGWLCEHSLKGASAPQLAGRESGKFLDLPKRQETIVLGCARRRDSEHRLNELQTWVRAAAISADTRDGHETLRLLLQPPRRLCASTGHYPHLPSWEPVQPATAKVPWSRDNFPGRTHGAPQAGAMSRQPQARPTFCTPPPRPPTPVWVSQSPLISCYYNPILSEREQTLSGDLHTEQRRGQIQSWTPGAVRTKKRKGNFSMQPQEQRIKSPQSTWCTLHLWNTWRDVESSQNSGGVLWEQL